MSIREVGLGPGVGTSAANELVNQLYTHAWEEYSHHVAERAKKASPDAAFADLLAGMRLLVQTVQANPTPLWNRRLLDSILRMGRSWAPGPSRFHLFDEINRYTLKRYAGLIAPTQTLSVLNKTCLAKGFQIAIQPVSATFAKLDCHPVTFPPLFWLVGNPAWQRPL